MIQKLINKWRVKFYLLEVGMRRIENRIKNHGATVGEVREMLTDLEKVMKEVE